MARVSPAPMLYHDVTKDFEATMGNMVSHELKTIERAQLQREPSARLELNTVADVVAFIKTPPEFADLADTFLAEKLDGPALRSLVRHWNSGSIRLDEVKTWFGVRTTGRLLKRKAVLDNLL